MSNGRSDSAISLSSARVPNNNNNSYRNNNNSKNGGPKKDSARRSQSQKHQRQTNRGKQNNSNQRPSTDAAEPAPAPTPAQTRSDEDADVSVLLSTPTKKPSRNSRKQKQQQKIVLLTRDAPESEQQALLAKLSASASSPASAPNAASSTRTPNKRSNRRRQATPPRADENTIVSSYSVPSLPAHAQQAQQQQQQRTPTRRPANASSAGAGRQRPLSGSNLSTIYSPTPRMGHYQQQPPQQQQQQSLASVVGVPVFNSGSPAVSKSNHYAGASFNNSPAPNTLPLPRVFMTSPSSVSPPAVAATANVRDEDVFGMAVPSGPMSPDQLLAQQRQYTQYQSPRQSMPSFPLLQGANVNAALDERSRQLESMMLFGNAQQLVHSKSPPPHQQHHVMASHYGSQSAVDLSQSASDMTTMFQKLRLIKEIAQNRASTVSPLPVNSVAVALSQHQHQHQQQPQQYQQLTSVYNA
ncbi:hypothetical protein LPJ56_005206 [Coemansia sp. RSA 2599]|nr:hypothetical protein LPJ56_005206 [Coemansia sp. RSA 2599]